MTFINIQLQWTTPYEDLSLSKGLSMVGSNIDLKLDEILNPFNRKTLETLDVRRYEALKLSLPYLIALAVLADDSGKKELRAYDGIGLHKYSKDSCPISGKTIVNIFWCTVDPMKAAYRVESTGECTPVLKGLPIADRYSIPAEMEMAFLEMFVPAVNFDKKADMPNHQYALAEAFRSPEGSFFEIETGHDESLMWVRKAAEKGHYHAQFELANCLLDGLGCEQNREEGMKWLQKAAENGVPEVLIHLKNEVDREERVKQLRTGAENGDRQAQWELACCLERGDGCNKDVIEASKWLSMYFEQGNK